jgi:ribosomal protein L17
MQKPGTSSWRWRELRRTADLGIYRGLSSGITHEDLHEPSKKRKPIRESVDGLVRESHVKTFTNRRRSKVKVVVPKSPGFECELVVDL